MMRILILCFWLVWGGWSVRAEKYVMAENLRPVSFDNDTLRHLGRVVMEEGRMGLYWAACGVELSCKTSSVYVELDSDAPDNYIQVIIDADEERPILIHATSGRKIYRVATSLKDTMHRITFRRRTDPTTMGCFLYRVWVDGDAELRMTPARKLKVEYYGDSVSSGHGDEAEKGDDETIRYFWNPTKAFTGASARLLDADYSILSKSGIGLMISWYDQVIGDIYNLQNPHDKRNLHDFTREQPDVVVVNIMQNDCWLINRMSPVPGRERIVAAYCEFAGKLAESHPNVPIVCALGPMNIVENSMWTDCVSEAVRILNKKYNNSLFTTCFFPYIQAEGHPGVEGHQVAALKLAEHIRLILKK